MLPCEYTVAPPLSPAERDRAADGLIADVLIVEAHVISDPAYPNTHSMTALVESITRRAFPDLHVLNKVVGWTLFEMKWREKYRPLTPTETDIHAAADRLSTAMHGPLNH
jgi:hypothetical protein